MKKGSVPLIYLAHKYRAPSPDAREANIALTYQWLRTLAYYCPEFAFALPWLPYVQALTEGNYRERGLRDDKRFIEACDGLLLVGPTVSSGMAIEEDHARASGKYIINIVPMSIEDFVKHAAERDWWFEAFLSQMRGNEARIEAP